MAVSPDGEAAGGGASRDRGPLDLVVRVDTGFTPLYRFLRVLVRLLNAVLFRTSVTRLGQYSEREGSLGLMLFTPMETTWTNQGGEMVKRQTLVLIRY